MRDGEVDFAGQLAAFTEHRAATPIDQLVPHFADEDEGRVVEFANLEELPDERHLQKRADAAGHHDEGVGDDHEVVQPREESAVPIRLAYERIYFLLEGQLDVEADGAPFTFWVNRVRSFIGCLHQ